jgi:hypothetical protein
MTTTDKPPLEVALDSLRKEEERLAAELRGVQVRQNELQTELTELHALMESIQKRLNAAARPQLTLAPAPIESYSDLPISEAVAKVLSVKGKPMTVPEIADELIARGFKSTSSNFKNLVGVTVRRLQGKRFLRDDGRWFLAA